MQEHRFQNQSGKDLFYRIWSTPSPKAAVLIVHGLGEHSGRYTAMAEHFNLKGYDVYALDHQGHGLSEGVRGHIDSFDDYASDVNEFVQRIKQSSKLPVMLIGHSLGALISTSFLIRYPDEIECAVLSSPGYASKDEPPKIKAFLGKLLGSILPKLTMGNEIDPRHVSRSSAIVDAYIKDPLVHDRVSAGWFVNYLTEVEYIQLHLKDINTPLLMLVSGNDKIVNPDVAREFFDKMGSERKEFIEYPEAYHEVFNEDIERLQAFAAIESFFLK